MKTPDNLALAMEAVERHLSRSPSIRGTAALRLVRDVASVMDAGLSRGKTAVILSALLPETRQASALPASGASRATHERLREVEAVMPHLPSEPPVPAVPLGTEHDDPDWVVCLEDGRKLKMLKRHLKARYNLTPDGYRARWGLPADYPLVARSYSDARRSDATALGLGTAENKAGIGSRQSAAV